MKRGCFLCNTYGQPVNPSGRGKRAIMRRNLLALPVSFGLVIFFGFSTHAMQKDAGLTLSVLNVDGGAVVNDQLLQFQADLLGVPVRRPVSTEATARGAAFLAGLAVGYWPDQAALSRIWKLDREFVPAMESGSRARLREGWDKAVSRARGWAAT